MDDTNEQRPVDWGALAILARKIVGEHPKQRDVSRADVAQELLLRAVRLTPRTHAEAIDIVYQTRTAAWRSAEKNDAPEPPDFDTLAEPAGHDDGAEYEHGLSAKHVDWLIRYCQPSDGQTAPPSDQAIVERCKRDGRPLTIKDVRTLRALARRDFRASRAPAPADSAPAWTPRVVRTFQPVVSGLHDQGYMVRRIAGTYRRRTADGATPWQHVEALKPLPSPSPAATIKVSLSVAQAQESARQTARQIGDTLARIRRSGADRLRVSLVNDRPAPAIVARREGEYIVFSAMPRIRTKLNADASATTYASYGATTGRNDD